MRESEELVEESKVLIRKVVEKEIRKKGFEWSDIKKEIRDALSSFLYQRTKRRPMIIPVLMEY